MCKTFIKKVAIEVPDPQRKSGSGRANVSGHVEGGKTISNKSEIVTIYDNKGNAIKTGGRDLLKQYPNAKQKQ